MKTGWLYIIPHLHHMASSIFGKIAEGTLRAPAVCWNHTWVRPHHICNCTNQKIHLKCLHTQHILNAPISLIIHPKSTTQCWQRPGSHFPHLLCFVWLWLRCVPVHNILLCWRRTSWGTSNPGSVWYATWKQYNVFLQLPFNTVKRPHHWFTIVSLNVFLCTKHTTHRTQ